MGLSIPKKKKFYGQFYTLVLTANSKSFANDLAQRIRIGDRNAHVHDLGKNYKKRYAVYAKL